MVAMHDDGNSGVDVITFRRRSNAIESCFETTDECWKGKLTKIPSQ